MSLKAGEDIPAEIHPNTTQFFRVEQGAVAVTINGIKKTLKDGQSIIVAPGKKHYVKCVKAAKLYTIYSPPEHPNNLIQKIKP